MAFMRNVKDLWKQRNQPLPNNHRKQPRTEHYQFHCKLTPGAKNVDPPAFQTFFPVDVAQNEGDAQQAPTGSNERQTSKYKSGTDVRTQE